MVSNDLDDKYEVDIDEWIEVEINTIGVSSCFRINTIETIKDL
jgi:hypothetical protein